MNKGNKLYEGKAKIIYETNDKELVIQHFKDDATAFNNLKKAKIEGKGVMNNRISEYLLTNLGQCGIKNHLIKRLNMREQLIKKADIFPIEFIVRNIATGSLTKRLNIPEAYKKLSDVSSDVSTHYLISRNGTIFNLLCPSFNAWHAGKSKWRNNININNYSIGIELENKGHDFGYSNFSKKQYNSLKSLISFLKINFFIFCKKYFAIRNRSIWIIISS